MRLLRVRKRERTVDSYLNHPLIHQFGKLGELCAVGSHLGSRDDNAQLPGLVSA